MRPLLALQGLLLAVVAGLGFVGLAYPNTRPRGAGATLGARVDRARCRPRVLRARRLARVPHVSADATPGRPARRRRDDLARRCARRVAAPDLHGSRLVDRPRARGGRDRRDRPSGRARPPARPGAVAPAARRPEPVPAGRRGGGVPRRPGRRAHAAARRAGRVHRGAHAPRRAPRGAGRRRARPRARAPSRPRRRRAPARHGQALRPRRDPEEAGLARPRRSTRSSSSTPSGARSCSRSSASRATCAGSSATTTSGSTDPATRSARTATQLDLETRIICACDVYDALISPRVYRGAWPHERAIGLLWDEAGKQFDARCVEALERVLDREQAPELAIAV